MSSMPQVVIENPVINSPFEEPKRHFKFDDEGITNEIGEAARASLYSTVSRPFDPSNPCNEAVWNTD